MRRSLWCSLRRHCVTLRHEKVQWWEIEVGKGRRYIVSRVPVKNSRFNPDLYPFEGWPYAGDRFELVSVGSVIPSLCCAILWWREEESARSDFPISQADWKITGCLFSTMGAVFRNYGKPVFWYFRKRSDVFFENTNLLFEDRLFSSFLFFFVSFLYRSFSDYKRNFRFFFFSFIFRNGYSKKKKKKKMCARIPRRIVLFQLFAIYIHEACTLSNEL